MPFKNREVQPELFYEIEKKRKTDFFKKNLFLFNYKSVIQIPIDNLIVLVISLIMANLLAFVLGIERGKNLTKLTLQNTPQETIVKEKKEEKNNIATFKQKAIEKVKAEQNIIEEKTTKQESPIAPVLKENFTIQLASYCSNTFANKALEQLKKDGFKVFVLEKGKYFVVCAGFYSDKKKAQESLYQFKKRYKDCLVRALVKS